MSWAVCDIEANNLIHDVTKVWVIAGVDRYTKKRHVFTDEEIPDDNPYKKYHEGSLRDGVKWLLSNDKVTFHNLMGYDWFVLNKFFPDLWNIMTAPPWSDFCQDSLIQSRVQWYDRPTPKGVKGNHSLGAYGVRFKYPKPPIDDWSFWDADKLHRVMEDIEINRLTCDYLDGEAADVAEMGIDFSATYRRAVNAQFWQTQQELNGWTADAEKMREHVATLDKKTAELASHIEPRLPKQIKAKAAKCTWSESIQALNEISKEYNEKCAEDDRMTYFKKYPKDKYVMEQNKNGDWLRTLVKPTYSPTVNIFTYKTDKEYYWLNTLTGEKSKSWKSKPPALRWVTSRPNRAEWELVENIDKKVKGYHANICKLFDLSPEDALDPKKAVVGGAFTRIEITDARMSQHAVVKSYLLNECGWKPTEWNYKKDPDGSWAKDSTGDRIKTSPKLTEDSFDSIEGELGQYIAEYNTLVHRRRTIENYKSDEKGWLNQIREDGRLSAGATVFGTSTGRMAQYGIVNVPSGSAVFGKQMREVWIAAKGHTLVSVDMDSAQLRILANYMDDEKFTYAVMSGTERDENHKYVGTDAHTVNGIAFGLINEDEVIEARRTQDEELIDKITAGRKLAKNGIYALLFGAGDEKFANTIKAKGGAREGKMIKETYFRNMPKLKALIDSLEACWEAHQAHGGGYVQVGDKWLWVKSKHKLLNYLLMGVEADIENEAVHIANKRFVDEGYQILNPCAPSTGVKWLCSYHDEFTIECPTEQVKEVQKIVDWTYGQASRNLGIREETLVTGTSVCGQSWLDVH